MDRGTILDKRRDTPDGAKMTTYPEMLSQAISQAESRYHRLVLVVGPPGSGKTSLLRSFAERLGYVYINAGISLGRRLLELTHRERSIGVGRLLNELVAMHDPPIVLLDNLEILFEPTLDVRPLDLLKAASRSRTVVAAWCVTYAGDTLTYAVPGHSECQRFRDVDALTISLDPNSTAAHRPSVP